MSLYRDKLTRRFFLFLSVLVAGMLLAGILECGRQVRAAKHMIYSHDSAVAGSLIAQGVPEEIVASALTSREYSASGADFLEKIGVTEQTKVRFLPFLASFSKNIWWELFAFLVFFSVLLFRGAFVLFQKQERLFEDAAATIRNFMEDDDSCHLPQLEEGAVYEMFSAVEQLLTMQRAKNETDQQARQFLKHTISDISHQLKTPLAALFMYQEIIEEEPENTEAVKEFSVKIRAALTRIERLIQLLLKITRLDAGSIVFEKRYYQAFEVVWYALDELAVRAGVEEKELVVEGDGEELLVCDLEWTAQAIANLVKNALDHTKKGDRICVSWERSPDMQRLRVADDGCGISDEDIHHIFKRFYRSRHCADAQGIGLGLPLAKAIVEGQGGVLSVESHVGEGTVFTVSLPYEIVS